MNEYNFSNLDPNEFEALANDLLGNLFHTHIERFKPGKDLGIDGRFFCYENDHSTIIQSKHYAVSGLKHLLYDLKNIELPKIEKLSTKRYILATSIGLSPQDKEKLKSDLGPHIKHTGDIFGKEDLNALLRQYPQVEKNHYKLWIASSTVLSRFLNAKVYTASQNIISEAYEKCANYVITNNHTQAKNKVKDTNVLVITGEPGVGKTTLAEQLCLEFVADDYEFFAINNDIEEGFSVYSQCDKQLFYFDDFLGKNYLETLRFNEDARIMQFISLIAKAKNKKFILTSRTNILDQGYRVGPSFSHGKIKKNEYIIDISQYNSTDKAKILYSFLWRSDLEKKFLEQIIIDKKYTKIIHHRNYNPRLLEFITSSDNIDFTNQNLYLSFIEKSLENPTSIWRHPYIAQLDDASRAVVDLIVFGNGNVQEESLKKAYNNFLNSGMYTGSTNISKDFESTMSILSRSFVKRTYIENKNTSNDNSAHSGVIKYSPFNPSISDFIHSRYANDYSHIADMVLLYDGDEGVKFLEKVAIYNDALAKNIAELICKKLKDNISFCNSIQYIRIGNLLDSDSFNKIFKDYNIEQIQKHILQLTFISEEILDFCYKLLSLKSQCDDKEIYNLIMSILNCDMSYYGIINTSSIIELYAPKDFHDEIVKNYYIKLIDAWKYERLEDFASDNVEKFSSPITAQYSECDFETSYEIDEDKLASLVAEDTADLYTPIEPADVKNMLSDIDLESIVSNFYESTSDDDKSSGGYSSGEQDIHGIFEGFLAAKFG